MTKKILVYSVTLGIICAVAALGVAGTYYLTALKDGPDSPIPAKQRQSRLDGMKLLFTGVGAEIGDVLNPDDPSAEHVYEAVRDGEVVAYATLGSARGYSSEIFVLTLVDSAAGTVLGILITEQNETPGLGTQVEDVGADATWGDVLAGKRNPLAAIGARYSPPEELSALSDFQLQFQGEDGEGVPVAQLRLARDGGKIDAITGATTSSDAAVLASRRAVERIQKALEQ